MKKTYTIIVACLLYFTSLTVFAEFIQSSLDNKSEQSVQLKTILSGKHKTKILSLDSSVNSQVLSLSAKVLKIWDITEQELLKSIEVTRNGMFVKARFSNSGSFLNVLSRNEFIIYDTKTFLRVASIPREGQSFSDFVITKDDKTLYLQAPYYGVDVYDLNKKEKINQFKIKNSSVVKLSPNERYIVGVSGPEINVYQSRSGDLVNSITPKEMPKYSFFLDDKKIGFIYIGREDENRKRIKQYVYSSFNFKSLDKTFDVVFEEGISAFEAFPGHGVSLLAFEKDNVIQVLDLTSKKKIMAIKAISNISKGGIHLSDDAQLLAMGSRDGGFKVCASNRLFKSGVSEVVVAKPQVIPETLPVAVIPAPSVVAKPVVQVQTLKIIPSATQGVAPLEVTFSIVTRFPGDVDSYYINMSGKETMEKGAPPMTLTKTFYQPGSFKVFVAIKDKKGNIIDSEVVIQPREETFSDFKKAYQ